MRRLALIVPLAASLAAPAAATAGGTITRVVWQTGTTTPLVHIATPAGRHAHVLVGGTEPEVSPNGRLIAYLRERGGGLQLWVIGSNGRGARRLSRNCIGAVVWAPDARHLACTVSPAASGSDHLYVLDTAQPAHPTFIGNGNQASFSPDSKRIAFSNITGASSDNAYVSSVAGTGAHLLVANAVNPLWGAPGIAYSAETPRGPGTAPQFTLMLIRADGTGKRVLAFRKADPLVSGLTPVAFSTNGRRLLTNFVGQDTSYGVTVDLTTKATHDVPGALSGFGLSRNGGWVLAISGGDSPGPDTSDVFRLRWNGSGKRRLAHHATTPSWNA